MYREFKEKDMSDSNENLSSQQNLSLNIHIHAGLI